MAVSRDLVHQLRHLLHPLSTRIANTVARGVVKLVNDAKKQQHVQLGVLAGETIDDGEHFQAYGFSSVPLPGAEAVVLFPNGDRGHPLVVAIADRRHRPKGGNPGEVTVYNNTGAKITITKDGDIVAQPAAGRQMLVREESGTAVELALKSDLQHLRTLLAAIPGTAAAITAMDTAVETNAPPTPTSPDQWPAGTKALKAE